jgi:hypothetical protein
VLVVVRYVPVAMREVRPSGCAGHFRSGWYGLRGFL